MNIIKRFASVGLATLIVVVTAGVLFSSADESDDKGHPKFDPDRRAAVQAAVEAGDYDAWTALVAEGRRGEEMLEFITADNFGRFIEMHNLRKAGDREGAKAIAEELGLPNHPFAKHKFRQWKKNHANPEKRAAVQAAVEAGDYDAWAALVGEGKRGEKMLEVITAENFKRFVEMHNLMKADDKEGAQEIREELGLPNHGKMMKNQFKRWNKNHQE